MQLRFSSFCPRCSLMLRGLFRCPAKGSVHLREICLFLPLPPHPLSLRVLCPGIKKGFGMAGVRLECKIWSYMPCPSRDVSES